MPPPPPALRRARARPEGTPLAVVAAGATLIGATVLVVGVPALVVAGRTFIRAHEHWSDVAPVLRSALSAQSLVSTLAYGSIVALIAVVIAWPAAFALAVARSRIVGVLVATPLLLPSYLAYSGWGLLRGPNTRFGDWLARQDPGLTVLIGKATAVLGMALWVWPLAAFILSGPIRTALAGGGVAELALVDAPGRWQRLRIMIAAVRAGALSAVLAVGLLMLGSAIPLHVAQVPTYAIELWKVMQLTPDPTGIWLAASPLLIVAGVVAGWLVARTTRQVPIQQVVTDPPAVPARIRFNARIGLGVAWTLAVLAPLGLYLWSLGSWTSIPMFWRLSGRGVAQSLRFAAVVAVVSAVLAGATWASLDLGGRWGRRIAIGAVGAFLFAGLLPGVLVGAASAASWGTPPLADWAGVAVVPITHLARFGFLPLLAGWWLWRAASPEHRWLLQMDGGRSVRGWLAGSMRPAWSTIAGVGCCMGALSLHEIESTVQVLPPGVANLPQQLLDYLHYARDEQLSAAAVNMLGIGVVLALTGSHLLFRRRRPGI